MENEQEIKQDRYDPERWAQQFAVDIAVSVSELPDRTPPEDWPEAMLVTASELSEIIEPRILPELEIAFESGRDEGATKEREKAGNNLPRCPDCGAPAGMDCRTVQGRIQPHDARLARTEAEVVAEIVAWLREGSWPDELRALMLSLTDAIQSGAWKGGEVDET